MQVVPEAKKIRTSGIDPEFEGKLDQMFVGIVATGDKAWAPSFGKLRSDFFFRMLTTKYLKRMKKKM